MEDDETGEKSWQNFIERNLLECYIKKIKEGKEEKYIVKLFFEGHSFVDKIEPSEIDEIKACLESMCRMIEIRSEKINEKLNDS